MTSRRVAAVVAGIILVISSGCTSDPTAGWSFVSTFPSGIETVSVPIAENDTFIRGVEFMLTEALVKQIASETPYQVAAGAHADTALLVQIRDVQLDELSKSPLTGLGEEVLVGMTIDFEWRDLTTEKPLVERRAFTGHGLFVPSAPSQERIELAELAVVEMLSRDIVNEMRSGW